MSLKEALHQAETFSDFSRGYNVDDVIETHLSYVVICGDYAFKLKKHVKLGPPFTDQTQLSERKRLCDEEFRKNCQWNTNGMYLGVFPLYKLSDSPLRYRLVAADRNDIPTNGDPVDYALWMRRFPSERQLDRVIARGEVSVDAMREFGARLGDLQTNRGMIIPKVREPIAEVMLENVDQLLATSWSADPAIRDEVHRLERWLQHELGTSLGEVLAARERGGKVRSLHADLHSGNLFLTEAGHIEMFDCLEFNDALAEVDVANDLAFLYMDLYFRNRPDLAWALVDAWLDRTGDFEAACVLRIFAVYRAAVRCKVAALSGKNTEARGYLNLALAFAARNRGAVVATVGRSGSGKSFWAAKLAGALRGFRVRSDVERKRMAANPEGSVPVDHKSQERILTEEGVNDAQQQARPMNPKELYSSEKSNKNTKEDDDGKRILNSRLKTLLSPEGSDVESKQDPHDQNRELGSVSRCNLVHGRQGKQIDDKGLYSVEASDRTYARLIDVARWAVLGSQTVVLDATYLSLRRRRDLHRAIQNLNLSLPEQKAVELVFVHFLASEKAMRERVVARGKEGKDCSDADLEVLRAQILEPFADDEPPRIEIRTDGREEEKEEVLAHAVEKLCTLLGVE